MASGEEAGKTSFFVSDAQELRRYLVFEGRNPSLSQGTKTPTGETWQALPATSGNRGVRAGAGGKFLWYFTADATDIVESEESQVSVHVWLVPIMPNGAPNWSAAVDRTLNTEDFVGFQSSAATDITCTAAILTRLGAFTVPDGYYCYLGQGKVHSYIGDDA